MNDQPPSAGEKEQLANHHRAPEAWARRRLRRRGASMAKVASERFRPYTAHTAIHPSFRLLPLPRTTETVTEESSQQLVHVLPFHARPRVLRSSVVASPTLCLSLSLSLCLSLFRGSECGPL